MKKTSKKFLIAFSVIFALFLLVNINKAYAVTSEFNVQCIYEKASTEEVFNLVNQQRVANGLNPLVWDNNLEKAAVQRAAEVRYYFSHERPNKKQWNTVLEELNVSNYYTSNGENIAAGYFSGQSVMEGWMNSSGHRANILNPNYNTIGIASVGGNWVQIFGYINNVAANTQRYIVHEKQTMDEKIAVEDLYIEPTYNEIEMERGAVVWRPALYFTLRSSTIPGFRATPDSVLDVKTSTNDSSALEIKDYNSRLFAYVAFKLIDFKNCTFTVEIGGKTATLNIKAIAPDMSNYVFDYKFYADKYADLGAAYGYNETALKNHWVNSGIAEGRQGSPIFDVKYYLNNNADLKAAFGNNYKAALDHFVNCGLGEGRKSSPEYCGEYYKNHNGDLANFSYYNLAIHFYNCGYAEGRKANDGVNAPVTTPAQKPTSTPAPAPAPAQTQTPSQPNWNGDVNGIVFNVTFYRKANADLAGMSDEALYSHWLSYGINEGRPSSMVFDAQYYLNNNGDLKAAFGSNYRAALDHFKEFGLKEGRKSSMYYDGTEYLSKNGDIAAAYGNKNYGAAAEHFLNFGIKEGRVASTAFNVKTYRNRYGDLSAAFGNDFERYYNHYVEFGRNEGRSVI